VKNTNKNEFFTGGSVVYKKRWFNLYRFNAQNMADYPAFRGVFCGFRGICGHFLRPYSLYIAREMPTPRFSALQLHFTMIFWAAQGFFAKTEKISGQGDPAGGRAR